MAKTANHYAKKLPDNQGLFVLDGPKKIQDTLKSIEVDEVWGIGRQYAHLLKSYGVNTAWEFTQIQDSWVKQRMTVVGLRVKKELEGISCLEMELVAPAKKAICTSRSFGESQTELEPIREAVANFALISSRSKNHASAASWCSFIPTGLRKANRNIRQISLANCPWPPAAVWN